MPADDFAGDFVGLGRAGVGLAGLGRAGSGRARLGRPRLGRPRLLKQDDAQIGPTAAGEIDGEDWHGVNLRLTGDGGNRDGGKFHSAIY